jgi:hypothetical protein
MLEHILYLARWIWNVLGCLIATPSRIWMIIAIVVAPIVMFVGLVKNLLRRKQ